MRTSLIALFWSDLILSISLLLAFPHTIKPCERCELNKLKYNHLSEDGEHNFLTLYNNPTARPNFLESSDYEVSNLTCYQV